jgi:peptide deformylase
VTVRPIREIGDPVLRTPADPVRAFDKDLAALVRDLEDTVDHPGRAGVAATQIGVGLSIPGLYAPTVRAMHCVAEGFDVHGEPLRIEGSGLLARCLQHEVDHLDGKLFVDRLTGEARKQVLRALRS